MAYLKRDVTSYQSPKLPEEKNAKKLLLDIGCGRDKFRMKGYKSIGLDCYDTEDVDIVFDIKTKLPFKDNTFDYIYSTGCFEHLTDWESILEECVRVLKKDGIIKIKVPFFSSDMNFAVSGRRGHKSFFGVNTMRGFLEGDVYNYVAKILFKEIDVKLHWKTRGPIKKISKIVDSLLNSSFYNQMIYQIFFCWIFPVDEVEYTFYGAHMNEKFGVIKKNKKRIKV